MSFACSIEQRWTGGQPQETSWYRLDIAHAGPSVTLIFDDSPERTGVLPLVGAETTYLIRLRRSAETIAIHGAKALGSEAIISARIRTARPGDFVRLASATLSHFRPQRIRFTSNDIAFFLGGSDRLSRAKTTALIRKYRRRNRDERLIRQFQISDQHCAEYYPTIDDDWACPPNGNPPKSAAAGAVDVAIYVHLFHAELWPDFCFALANCRAPFDLHVSMPDGNSALATEIRARFPAAIIHFVENRGRDIWPFVSLLQTGAFDRYKAVCKLHGKKSEHLTRPDADFDVGRRWRRSAILELLGTPKRIDHIVERFGAGKPIGLIGPSNLWLAARDGRPDEADWGLSKNLPTMKLLASRMGIADSDLRLDFFAGAMFWFAPDALRALARAGLTAEDFEPEPLAAEGALPHAIERLFNIVARSAGYSAFGSREIEPAEGS